MQKPTRPPDRAGAYVSKSSQTTNLQLAMVVQAHARILNRTFDDDVPMTLCRHLALDACPDQGMENAFWFSHETTVAVYPRDRENPENAQLRQSRTSETLKLRETARTVESTCMRPRRVATVCYEQMTASHVAHHTDRCARTFSSSS